MQELLDLYTYMTTRLTGELGAVDGLASSAVVVGEVATLAHEVRDHPADRKTCSLMFSVVLTIKTPILAKKSWQTTAMYLLVHERKLCSTL